MSSARSLFRLLLGLVRVFALFAIILVPVIVFVNDVPLPDFAPYYRS